MFMLSMRHNNTKNTHVFSFFLPFPLFSLMFKSTIHEEFDRAKNNNNNENNNEKYIFFMLILGIFLIQYKNVVREMI